MDTNCSGLAPRYQLSPMMTWTAAACGAEGREAEAGVLGTWASHPHVGPVDVMVRRTAEGRNAESSKAEIRQQMPYIFGLCRQAPMPSPNSPLPKERPPRHCRRTCGVQPAPAGEAAPAGAIGHCGHLHHLTAPARPRRRACSSTHPEGPERALSPAYYCSRLQPRMLTYLPEQPRSDHTDSTRQEGISVSPWALDRHRMPYRMPWGAPAMCRRIHRSASSMMGSRLS